MPNAEWLRKTLRCFVLGPWQSRTSFPVEAILCSGDCRSSFVLVDACVDLLGAAAHEARVFRTKRSVTLCIYLFFSWENVLLWYFGDQHMYMYTYIYICSMYDIGLSKSRIGWCLWLKGRGKTWFHKGYQTFWVYVAEAQRRVWWQVTLRPISNMQFDPMFFICLCETSKYTFIAMLLVRQWYSNVEMSFCTSLDFVTSISIIL